MDNLPPMTFNCWLNGTLMDIREARVSVLDHGLLYGDGIFEGVRFYNTQPFRLQQHLLRLERSARAICLDMPYDTGQLEKATFDLVERSGLADGYLRLVVTRGEGSLGLDPASCSNPNVFFLAAPLTLVDSKVLEHGASLIIASTRRLPPHGLDSRIKSLNYLNQILAKTEANRAGADEAIMLNDRGFVAEGTAENVFIARDGELLTPPVTDGALAGVTRALVMELIQARPLPIRQSTLTPYDLYTAEECFLTGTGAELIPVREIDGRRMTHSPGPLYRRLLSAFHERIRDETTTAAKANRLRQES